MHQTPSSGDGLSPKSPSQEEVVVNYGPVLQVKGRKYKKIKRAFLRPAVEGEVIKTVLNGECETVNTAKKGDWIVQADTTDKEQYILPQEKFERAYEPEGEEVRDHPDAAQLNADGFKAYSPKTRITACEVSPEDLESHFPAGTFTASWGEPMLVKAGDYLAGQISPEGNVVEIYRIEKNAFAQTYDKDDDDAGQAEDILRRLETLLLRRGRRYRKARPGLSRPAAAGEEVGKSRMVASEGDWILHGGDASGERSLLNQAEFEAAFEGPGVVPEGADAGLAADGFRSFTPRVTVVAFEIEADDDPELFVSCAGDPLLVKQGNFLAGDLDPEGQVAEIYGVEREVFLGTYVEDTANAGASVQEPTSSKSCLSCLWAASQEQP